MELSLAGSNPTFQLKFKFHYVQMEHLKEIQKTHNIVEFKFHYVQMELIKYFQELNRSPAV